MLSSFILLLNESAFVYIIFNDFLSFILLAGTPVWSLVITTFFHLYNPQVIWGASDPEDYSIGIIAFIFCLLYFLFDFLSFPEIGLDLCLGI